MKYGTIAFGLFFLILGTLSLAIGLLSYREMQATLARAEKYTATLTDYVPNPDPKAPDFCPVYEFTTNAGKQVSYTGDNCVGKPDQSTIGSHEQVFVDPDNPYQVETKGLTGSEGGGLILGLSGFAFFGVLMGLIPLIVGLLMKRPAKASAQPAASMSSETWEPEARLGAAREKLADARIALAEVQQLKELRDSNMISETDYQKKKQEIASKLKQEG